MTAYIILCYIIKFTIAYIKWQIVKNKVKINAI